MAEPAAESLVEGGPLPAGFVSGLSDELIVRAESYVLEHKMFPCSATIIVYTGIVHMSIPFCSPIHFDDDRASAIFSLLGSGHEFPFYWKFMKFMT